MIKSIFVPFIFIVSKYKLCILEAKRTDNKLLNLGRLIIQVLPVLNI
jgi:hypothetical protein